MWDWQFFGRMVFWILCYFFSISVLRCYINTMSTMISYEWYNELTHCGPSNIKWQHNSVSRFAKAMNYCLITPSHCLACHQMCSVAYSWDREQFHKKNVHGICSEITVFKSLPHLPGDSELMKPHLFLWMKKQKKKILIRILDILKVLTDGLALNGAIYIHGDFVHCLYHWKPRVIMMPTLLAVVPALNKLVLGWFQVFSDKTGT